MFTFACLGLVLKKPGSLSIQLCVCSSLMGSQGAQIAWSGSQPLGKVALASVSVVLCISPFVTLLRLNPAVLVGNSPEALLPPVEAVLDAP